MESDLKFHKGNVAAFYCAAILHASGPHTGWLFVFSPINLPLVEKLTMAGKHPAKDIPMVYDY